MVHDFHTAEPAVRPQAGDWFVISRTLLQGAYLEPDRELALAGLTSGQLQREWITAWGGHCKALREKGRVTPRLGDWLVQAGHLSPAQLESIAAPLLTTWIDSLRTREPDARIGGSLVAFKI